MDRVRNSGRTRIPALIAGITFLLAVSGGVGVHAQEKVVLPAARASITTPAQLQAVGAHWPLSFEPNVGQVQGTEGSRVKFTARGSAYTLFLTSREAVLALAPRDPAHPSQRKDPAVVRMRLGGAARNLQLAGHDELPGKSNYFRGNDPSQWHRGVANFARVSAANVYPGIDLVYHGHQGQLEYDFDVAPHADPRRIRLMLEGTSGLAIDSEGDLIVKIKGGELYFRRPVAYQYVEGSERPVDSGYVLKGKNQIAFEVAPYDERQPLVIDPILGYSTYLGGSNIDGANGIAVAPDGTAFIAGGTFSMDFPTAGAHPLQPNDGGPLDFPQDGFVSKLSADGSTLLFSTYLGGSNSDIANAIAVDAAGEAFVTGTTNSKDFPVSNTVGGFDLLCGGDGKCGATWNPQGLIVSNAFVTKLNTAGSDLVYSTYLGYYENVQGLGIAVDGALNAYVTGAAGPNIPVTVLLTPPEVPPPPFPIVGGFQTTFLGSVELDGVFYGGDATTNAFIVKISSSGNAILYSSYIGGEVEDAGYGVAVDSLAHAYVAGLTYSTLFPTTGTALQTTNAGAGDAFLTKVNTNVTGGASLVYSTYLGGNGLDQANGVAVDDTGKVYIAGGTNSVSLGFTAPAGAYQPSCALDSVGVCEGDAFVAKLDPTLGGAASLDYFTYLGGSLADSAAGIAVDSSGDVFITGKTVSTNFPIFGPVFQPLYGGGNADAFVTELNPKASALVFSTYLGGSDTDTGNGIAIDTTGDAFVAGQTCSLNFPLAAPLQETTGGNCDAFVSKIIPSGGVSIVPGGLIFPNQDLNTKSAPQTLTLTNGGSAALTVSSIAVTGTNSADFAETNTCGASVPPLGTCTISVTFAPTSVNPPTRTAQITVTDSGSNSPQVVDLTGTAGTAPLVTLSSSSLTFTAPQQVGVASPPLNLMVTNTGTAPLAFSSVMASGEFAVSANNCTSAPLQVTTPPSDCTISVTFTPIAAGTSAGSLTLVDNAPNSPQIILLTGTGASQPVVTVSPTSLSFPSQALGSASAPQTVTISNSGTAVLTLTGVSIMGGDFSLGANSCGPTVAANGGSCTVNVVFTPQAAGTRTGTLVFTDNAANSPQTVALVGVGGTSLDFALAVKPTSATVVAGSAGNVMVTVTPFGGFSSAVTLSCSGLPALSTCSSSPSSITPNGTSPASSTLMISTTVRTSLPPRGKLRTPGPGLPHFPSPLWALMILLTGIMMSFAVKGRQRWTLAALALTALLLMSFAACGGGGNGYTNPTGTPAGNYTVTVTGTAGNLSHSTRLSLTVQ